MLYVVGGVAVFVGSGVMAMAGLGAAFLFVPLFYYLGVPLGEATSTALLLNAVSLSAATVSYARGGLIDWRAGIPVLIAAVILAPFGAASPPQVDKRAAARRCSWASSSSPGAMMLFYRPRARRRATAAPVAEAGVGAGARQRRRLPRRPARRRRRQHHPARADLARAATPRWRPATTALAVVFASLVGLPGPRGARRARPGLRAHDGASLRPPVRWSAHTLCRPGSPAPSSSGSSGSCSGSSPRRWPSTCSR